MEPTLAETQFMDYSNPVIQEVLTKLDLDGLDDREKTIRLFYYVRDLSKYSVKRISLYPEHFKASYIVKQSASYCIPKALLLCTLARGSGIPARLHFVDFINHRLSDGLRNLWGTNVMASHCYAELKINGKWVKATPALDAKTCENHHFRNVEFDGEHDALLHSTDRDGNPHAEYINDHGVYNDLPLPLIIGIFEKNYGHMSDELIKKMFNTDVSTFR